MALLPKCLALLALAALLLPAPQVLASKSGHNYDMSVRSSTDNVVVSGIIKPRAPADSATAATRAGATSGPAAAVGDLGNKTRYEKPYIICTAENVPMVVCTDPADPSSYDGYQIELFKRMATAMDWDKDDWTFQCTSEEDLMHDLEDPNGICYAAAAGLPLSYPNMAKGIQYSWPTYRSGLKVMVASQKTYAGMWAFTAALTWDLWLALGLTAVAISFVVFGLERWNPYRPASDPRGLQGWAWYIFAKLTHSHSHVGDPRSWGSRIVVLAYGFLMMIIVHLYVATVSVQLKSKNYVTIVDDIQGLKNNNFKVVTAEKYVDMLGHYGITPIAKKLDTTEELSALFYDLKKGKYDAVVLDAPVVDYFSGIDEDCKLTTRGGPIYIFDLAVAFPVGFNYDDKFVFDTTVIKLQSQQQSIDKLDPMYVKVSSGGCSSGGGGGGHGGPIGQVQFSQVSGLWVVLAIGAGIGAILLGIHNYWIKKTGHAPGHKTPVASGQAQGKGKGDHSQAAAPGDNVEPMVVRPVAGWRTTGPRNNPHLAPEMHSDGSGVRLVNLENLPRGDDIVTVTVTNAR